jgi:hypothetical protein
MHDAEGLKKGPGRNSGSFFAWFFFAQRNTRNTTNLLLVVSDGSLNAFSAKVVPLF